MKLRRGVFILASLIAGTPSLWAQAMFVWNGQTAYPGGNDVTVGANWVGVVAPTGDGTENATFGDLTSGPAFVALDTQQNIDLNVPFSLRDLTFNGANRPDYSFNGTGTFTLTGDITTTMGRAGGADVTLGGGIGLVLSDTYSATHTLDVNGMFLNIFSDISEVGAPGSLVLNGDGAYYLAGNNTFTGGVTVNTTTLFLNSSLNPAGTGTLTLSNGSTLYPFNFAAILPNAVSLPGGTVVLNSITDSQTQTSADSLTFNGALSGPGAIALYGAGPVTFNADNSAWSGGIKIFEYATINVNDDNGLGTGILSFDAASQAEVIFNSSNPVIYGLAGDATNSEIYLNSGAVLTIDQSTDTTYQGTITDGTAPGSIVKTGPGSLTLTGYSDYLGTTTVNAGTLVASGGGVYLGYNTIMVNGGTLAVINGAWLGNTVQVNATGLLTGTGYISNAFINAGGILAPGGANCPIGSLSFDDLTLGTDAKLEWNAKDPGSFDQVFVFNASTLTINATSVNPFTIKLISLDASDLPGMATGFIADQNYQFVIFSTSGISGFDPASFIIDSSMFTTDGGPDGIFSFDQLGNDLVLNFTPVPEPSTYALLGLGLGAVVLPVLRRRKRG